MVYDTDKTRARALKLDTQWKTTYHLGVWLHISSGDGFYLWLLDALVYLTLLSIYTVGNSWVLKWIPKDFTSNIKSFGLSSICVVCDIEKTQGIQH